MGESSAALPANLQHLSEDIIPEVHNTYNLGSSSKWWAALFAVLITFVAITGVSVTTDYLTFNLSSGGMNSSIPMNEWNITNTSHLTYLDNIDTFSNGKNLLIHSSLAEMFINLTTSGVSSIYGGSASGDDFEIHANSVNTYPYMTMLGNSDINYFTSSSRSVRYTNELSNFMRISAGATSHFRTTRTTSNAWDFDLDTITSGDALTVSCDGLTTGACLNIDQGGVDSLSIINESRIKINNIYGEMWFHNDTAEAVLTQIAAQDTWYNVSGFNQSTESGQTSNGFIYDDASETLTAQVAGLYKVDWSLSFGNLGNNIEYLITVGINGANQDSTEAHRKIGAAGDVGDSSSSGLLSLSVDDKITLMVLNDDGSQDIYTHAANINLVRIGN